MTSSIRFLALAAIFSLSSACSKKAPPPPPRPPAPVIVADAIQRDVPVILRATGNVEASEIVNIKSQLSGEIVKVNVREGQDVRKGDVLFQLDSRSYHAQLKKAEATLAKDRVIMENARTNYERYRQLVKDGIVTAEQAESYRTAAESAEASVAADRAEVEHARTQLSWCTITAPTSGRLGALAVHQGNVVKANEVNLVTINRITPVKVLFSIPERDLGELKRHMAAGKVVVEAEVAGTPPVREKGLIDFMDNTVDVTSGTIKLKGAFQNSRKQLWPGQMVNVSITLAVRRNAVVVPTQAVQTGQQGQYVLIVKQDSTSELRPVVTGPASNGLTLIEKGVQSGEKVIIDGQIRVIPGTKVEIKAGNQGSGIKDSKPVPSPESHIPTK